MFINCSNHASANWSDQQVKAASEWGEIVDYPFPSVPADADEKKIAEMAEAAADEMAAMNPEAVMCQGEFTLTFALTERLKLKGIPVVAACSQRKTTEVRQPDGGTKKISEFCFTRFREYGQKTDSIPVL